MKSEIMWMATCVDQVSGKTILVADIGFTKADVIDFLEKGRHQTWPELQRLFGYRAVKVRVTVLK